MNRFQLNVYDSKPPKKGKIIKKDIYDSPLEARLSSKAQKAEYWEIVDKLDNRVIEIKIEEGE